MIGDDFQQTNSEGSNGYQAKGDINITTTNTGITYTEARQISIDLWHANALQLSQEAGQLAQQRAEDLFEEFLAKITDKDPNLLNALRDPGMQMALYSAERDYAKTGDKDVSKMLIDILAERAANQTRNLGQIALDESLTVVPKLTEEHLDALTLSHYINWRRFTPIIELEDLGAVLESFYEPFIDSLVSQSSCVQHLQYCNCATYVPGFTTTGNKRWYGLVNNVIQLAPALFPKAPGQQSTEANATFMDKSKDLINHNWPFMEKLTNVYGNYMLDRIHPTTVGRVLAQANRKRKTGASISIIEGIV